MSNADTSPERLAEIKSWWKLSHDKLRAAGPLNPALRNHAHRMVYDLIAMVEQFTSLGEARAKNDRKLQFATAVGVNLLLREAHTHLRLEYESRANAPDEDDEVIEDLGRLETAIEGLNVCLREVDEVDNLSAEINTAINDADDKRAQEATAEEQGVTPTEIN